jgi:hypothetical protein
LTHATSCNPTSCSSSNSYASMLSPYDSLSSASLLCGQCVPETELNFYGEYVVCAFTHTRFDP